MEITRVPQVQCKQCNIGTLREFSATEYKCDWCSSATPIKDVK